MITYEQFIFVILNFIFYKKTAKNYSLIIFYFFLSLFSPYIQTEIIYEKKNIYGYIFYIIM